MKIDKLTPCNHSMRSDGPNLLDSADVQRILMITDKEEFGHGIFVYKEVHHGYFRPQGQHCSQLVKTVHPVVLESMIQDIGVRLALCEAATHKWPSAHLKSITATDKSITAYQESSVWSDILYSFEKIGRTRCFGNSYVFKMKISAWSVNGGLIAVIKATGAVEIWR